MQETTNEEQRYLAIMFAVNFIASFWVTVGLWTFNRDLDGFIELFTTFQIGWIMLTIVVFYFGGGLSESVGRSFKKKDKPSEQ